MTYKTFPIPFEPLADPAAIVTCRQARFTVLTSRLIRMGYSPRGEFEDRPSQVFWFRRQPAPDFQVVQTPQHLEIITQHLHLQYQATEQGFTPQTLSIRLEDDDALWHYGDRDPSNLLGTGRTLDRADGAIPLEAGLMSRSGWALLDDSTSLVFDQEGWLETRNCDSEKPGSLDLYFFGYGHDYIQCLQDYCKVSGSVPLLPRWVLGNWWSRYWAYTQAELSDLMMEFRAKEAPLSVCIIDMDWHITKTGNTSSGWTGYTWNRELFPDPPGFIQWLHEQGLKTALNLHPAEGIHPHESQYDEMSRFMGIDPQGQMPVPFDIADPLFTKGYFDILHHPMEKMGVDFWWMDWQQGQRIEKSRQQLAQHLDPLWWLNHLHHYDLARDGKKRSIIFSRWGGFGNHRYPIGFSGDSVVSWASLAFQPYFTATAANVAYGWWSHDIGGHMLGIEDPELYTRWVQFGVFSPILRLHCTKDPYQDRRPWGFGAEVLRITRQAMQLRHALIPYLYSMARRASQESIPLVTPLYYDYPEKEEAYQCPNQYCFGSELIAAPFVTSRDPHTNMSRQTIWLPEGNWFDFFNGEYYQGGQWITLYGALDEIPVFARAGGILPLGPRVAWGGVENPAELSIQIFPGADGSFTLYEDDGASPAYLQGEYSLIRLSQTWREDHLNFKIEPAQGDLRHIPATRKFHLVVWGVRQPDSVQLWVNGILQNTSWELDVEAERLSLANILLEPTDELELVLSRQNGSLLSKRDRRLETCRKMLRSFHLETAVKSQIDMALPKILEDVERLTPFARVLSDAQWSALRTEITRRKE